MFSRFASSSSGNYYNFHRASASGYRDFMRRNRIAGSEILGAAMTNPGQLPGGVGAAEVARCAERSRMGQAEQEHDAQQPGLRRERNAQQVRQLAADAQRAEMTITSLASSRKKCAGMPGGQELSRTRTERDARAGSRVKSV